MADPAENILTSQGNPGTDGDPALPDTSDALSAPDNAILLPQALMLLPRGAAWGTPDNEAARLDTTMAGFWRAAASPFERLYARAFTLAGQSRAVTVNEGLEDWETDYGLPDSCTPAGQSRTARFRSLLAKVRSTGTITPADFIDVARDLGYLVLIEEVFGFECGFSECGGEHETGPLAEDFTWIVRVLGVEIEYFRCGESECGLDPLFEVLDAEPIVCRFMKLAPGWTMPIFDFRDVDDPLYLTWRDIVWPDAAWGFGD